MKSSASQILPKNQKQILDKWMNHQLKDDGLREDLLSNDDLRKESDALLTAILTAVRKDNFTDVNSQEYDKVNEILAGISMSRASNGFSPRETAVFVFSLKDAFIEVLHENIPDPSALNTEISKVNKLLDSLALITLETFIKGREEVILRQTSEISEISTPVIQVWDGILALPIIGTLDSARTQVVMESLLLKIVDTESTIAILDISGVPAVDSLVAQHLIKTVAATRLMGAECIISGIRPEIAQTIVHLGIDLSNINTKSSLAHALRTAFKMTKLEVRKTSEIK
ncbi:MAG TPA: STAS domain-containing protein, partial [Chitinophagaceae bacterium]|jgi:rsbT co-antagonist protein RsbR|nr:STAS domain-containing protein [Chitinophagaceae bacterium]